MIFLTVGTQLPFDRLVHSMDKWAANNVSSDVFGQIGSGGYKPVNFRATENIDADEYREVFTKAELIVSHAGMGSIISAFEYAKPIVLMPRLFKFGEHRNDHQVATYERFKGRTGLYFCQNELELFKLLDKSHELLPCGGDWPVSRDLIDTIKSFLSE